MKGLDLQIETRKQASGMTYIDTLIEFAEKNLVDMEDLVKELHSSMIDKIKIEFIELKMVKGQTIDTRIEEFMD